MPPPRIAPFVRPCTPAARRGGSLNAHMEFRPPLFVVHPGSPPGWESQRCGWVGGPRTVRRAPRQPAGVGVSTGEGPMCGHGCASCTPAARRGGSLNFACVATDVGQWLVHPGSPPGWESQHDPPRELELRVPRAPRQPAGVGVSTSSGGVGIESSRRAPRQPAGVGVSTSTRRTDTRTAPACTPAARRGGSLNKDEYTLGFVGDLGDGFKEDE